MLIAWHAMFTVQKWLATCTCTMWSKHILIKFFSRHYLDTLETVSVVFDKSISNLVDNNISRYLLNPLSVQFHMSKEVKSLRLFICFSEEAQHSEGQFLVQFAAYFSVYSFKLIFGHSSHSVFQVLCYKALLRYNYGDLVRL